jgi:hypothetical protein
MLAHPFRLALIDVNPYAQPSMDIPRQSVERIGACRSSIGRTDGIRRGKVKCA